MVGIVEQVMPSLNGHSAGLDYPGSVDHIHTLAGGATASLHALHAWLADVHAPTSLKHMCMHVCILQAWWSRHECHHHGQFLHAVVTFWLHCYALAVAGLDAIG